MTKKLSLALLSATLSLVFAECIVRWVYTPKALAFRMRLDSRPSKDRSLKFTRSEMRFVPGSVGSLLHSEFENSVRIDALGFRNACPYDRLQAVNFGDSFVFGVGVQDDETISCEIARQFGVATYSVAIPGAGPLQYFLLIKKHGRRLVDLAERDRTLTALIYLFLGNDIQQLTHSTIDANRSALPERAKKHEPSFLASLNRAIFHDSPLTHSYMMNLVKLALIRSLKVRQEASDYLLLRNGTAVFRRNLDSAIRSKHLASVRANLRILDDAARQVGFSRVVFVLIPPIVSLSEDVLEAEVGLQGYDPAPFDGDYSRRVILEAAASGLEVFDPSACMKAGQDQRDLYYVTDAHLTPQGVERLVSCMRGLFAELQREESLRG